MRNASVFTFVVTSNPCAQNVISHQWLMSSYLKDSVSLYICSCASACQFVCFVLFLFWIVPWYLKVIQGFCAFWKAISQLIVSFWSSLFFYSSICQDRQSSTSSSFLLWICVIFISRSIRVYQQGGRGSIDFWLRFQASRQDTASGHTYVHIHFGLEKFHGFLFNNLIFWDGSINVI